MAVPFSEQDRQEVIQAVNAAYSEGVALVDGYLVIDRQAFIRKMSLGAMIIFEMGAHDPIGESLNLLMPKEVESRHAEFLRKEFEKLDAALANPGIVYTGRFMTGSPNDEKPRYIKGLTAKQNEVSFGLEFLPLVWGLDPKTNKPNVGFVGLVSEDPSFKKEERVLAQTSEATKVVQNARTAFYVEVADQTGNRLDKLYRWYEDKFVGLPGHRLIALFFFLSTIIGASIGAYFAYQAVFGKPSTNQHLNIQLPPEEQSGSSGGSGSQSNKK